MTRFFAYFSRKRRSEEPPVTTTTSDLHSPDPIVKKGAKTPTAPVRRVGAKTVKAAKPAAAKPSRGGKR